MPSIACGRPTISSDQQPEIDKEQLYGRYQRPADARAQLNTERLQWQDQLARQVTHKWFDEPIDEAEPMNLRVHNGFDWKSLAVIGATFIGLGAVTAYSVRSDIRSDREVIREIPEKPSNHTDRDTLVVPRLRFGPDR